MHTGFVPRRAKEDGKNFSCEKITMHFRVRALTDPFLSDRADTRRGGFSESVCHLTHSSPSALAPLEQSWTVDPDSALRSAEGIQPPRKRDSGGTLLGTDRASKTPQWLRSNFHPTTSFLWLLLITTDRPRSQIHTSQQLIPFTYSIRMSSHDARSLEEGERKEKFHPNGSNDAHVLNDLHGGHVDPYIADPEHMNEAGKWIKLTYLSIELTTL